MRERADALEEEARHTKVQLSEMARTATEYSNMIKQKEDEVTRVVAELDKSRQERGRLIKEITELQSKVDTLTSELQNQQQDSQRNVAAHARLQEELDELRNLLQTKVTEETRRSEVEKSKEAELANLREQVAQLSHDLNDARMQAIEGQSKLKLELDTIVREYRSLESSHKSLLDRESAAQAQLKQNEVALSDAVRARRTLDSDLQSLRSRQIDLDGQLANMTKEKEVRLTLRASSFFDLTILCIGTRAQASYCSVQIPRLRRRSCATGTRQVSERSTDGR